MQKSGKFCLILCISKHCVKLSKLGDLLVFLLVVEFPVSYCDNLRENNSLPILFFF